MPGVRGRTNNPNGRPPRPEIVLFRKALAKIQKQKGKDLMEHACEMAYTDNRVLTELLKKILPDKMSVEKEDIRQIILIRANEPVKDNAEPVSG